MTKHDKKDTVKRKDIEKNQAVVSRPVARRKILGKKILRYG